MFLKTKTKNLNINKKPLIVGILNLTPDSFYDGTKNLTKTKVLKQVERMVKEGADIIDIGAESTRPNSERISLREEEKRIKTNLIEIIRNFDIPISIDTMKSEIADLALSEGAEIINDVTGFQHDSKMPSIIGHHKAAVIINHTPSMPENMQRNTSYTNITKNIKDYFVMRIKQCSDSKINKKSIILDPGIGFGKTTNQNLRLIKDIRKFSSLNLPIMMGVSNKSFIGNILNISDPRERINGSIVASLLCLQSGAKLIRVHNVKETSEMIKIWSQYENVRN
ncbi:dihydropteroate synthase [bacterium]|jgi:dihydropteroate synthase|nr:dihydropteroate synthase [bacterium]MBT3850484.1 dihydropteroate synthase [bacterium]MBT4435801.1 dihydropteroate synthase [bacterium]MDG2446126.1 dihydropteroate synthase [Thermodesulfobacteriota bacterium]|tara:strand:- start:343 stop:1185 length:843 start_codon:yes stop_codon:yes gene_type:complete